MLFKAFRAFIYFFFCKLLYRVEFINVNKEKQLQGKNVVCANHNDWMDAVVMWTKTEKVRIMAKAELFKVPVWSHLIRAVGAFPIKRGAKDFKSIYHAVKEVEDGNNLVIFPEGTRKAKQKNVKAKVGAVHIAISAGADIIPVYIEPTSKRPFSKIRVMHGEPYSLSQYKDEIKDKELLKKLTEELMEKIYNLGENLNDK